MNKKELIDLGIDPDVADQIIILHGKDIESHKTKLTTLQGTLDTVNAQLTEAGTTIEGFKKLDVAGIQKAADDYKAQAEQAKLDADKQIAALRFEHALDGALSEAKARNPKAVRALLKTDDLKLDADGKLIGFTEQITKVKADNDFLFIDEKEAPRIVLGGNNQPVITDAVVAAARKAAGVAPAP